MIVSPDLCLHLAIVKPDLCLLHLAIVKPDLCLHLACQMMPVKGDP